MTEKERNSVKERVNKALDKIRPYLEADGGGITLEEITDDMVVKVKLHGACDGCPFSYQTLKAGVEQALLKEVPEMKELIALDKSTA
jgi:Fe-S cluster biogenesis protein NfuA